MIEEAFVNFKIAKLLSEKGFIIDSSKDYWKIGQDGSMYFMSSIGVYSDNPNDKFTFYRPKESYPCLTQQMAMRWLRVIRGLFIQFRIVPHSTETMEQKYYFYSIFKNRREISSYYEKSFYFTYEEAVDAALEYVLENLI